MNQISERIVKKSKFVQKSDDNLIICRCEEITKGEIRKAVYDGMHTFSEVKRFVRSGMGLCQAQTCGKLVRGIIAEELGVKASDLDLNYARPPMRPLLLKTMSQNNNDMRELRGSDHE